MKNSSEEIMNIISGLHVKKLKITEEIAGSKGEKSQNIDLIKLSKKLRKCEKEIEEWCKIQKKVKLCEEEGDSFETENKDYTAKNNAYLKVRRLYPILNI